ncbi:MAG: hypothetical protein ACHQIM_15185 [Sphingobacteriales bacterium]
MKQKITLTLDAETHKQLKDEANRRNITLKQLGEEYFYKITDKIIAERKALLKTP